MCFDQLLQSVGRNWMTCLGWGGEGRWPTVFYRLVGLGWRARFGRVLAIFRCEGGEGRQGLRGMGFFVTKAVIDEGGEVG